MDVVSYVVGKKSGGKNTCQLDFSKTYNTTYGLISIITNFNGINVGNATNLTNLFKNCSSLKSAPYFDTSKVTTMNNMFVNCYYLEDIPLYDTSKVTTMPSIVSQCSVLTDTSLDNLLQMCINASSNYSGTKNLYALGLRKTYYPQSRIEALPHYQDFIDAGWTTGLN